MSASNFILNLSDDESTALRIQADLESLTARFVEWKLKSYCGRSEPADVSDIVQETLLIAYANNARGKILDFSDPPASLKSYFFCIADNLCKVFRRRSFREEGLDKDDNEEGRENQYAAQDENPEERLIRIEREEIRRDCLKNALNDLQARKPEDYRIWLAYSLPGKADHKENKAFRERLAASINLSLSALTVRACRIKAKLQTVVIKCVSGKLA